VRSKECASVTTTEDESEYEDERWTCASKRLMELHLKNKISRKICHDKRDIQWAREGAL
jgi:hypothetical protein